MLQLKICFGDFSQPWEKTHVWKKHNLEETRYDTNKIDQNKKQEMRVKAQKMKEGGEWGFNMAKHLRPEDLKRRDDNIEALKFFQKEMGIDESKYIEEFEDCGSGREIRELEGKIKKASTKWYERRIVESRAYEPIDGTEFASMNKQIQGLIAWFGNDKRSLMDMAVTHERFDEDIKYQKNFREKLRKQSTFIRTEYSRRVKELEDEEKNQSPMSGAPKKDRSKLLDEIIEEVKEVKDSPSAVQHEFSKLKKKADSSKSTKEIKEEVTKAYETKTKEYRSEILKNAEYFGGEKVKTKYGEMSETAWEFIEWFETQDSFTSMDGARKKLNGLIKERKKLCQRRDEILEHANPEERGKLKAKTQKMRRHELEAFLPELEANVRKNSIHMLEYLGLLHTARLGNINLFKPEEIVKMSNQFKLKNVKDQEAYLIVLQDTIEDRKKTAAAYFKLPVHARNDEAFLKANAYEREKMLADAYEQMNREEKNPLAISNSSNKTPTEIAEELLSKITGEPGRNEVGDIIGEMEQQGSLDIAESQLSIRSKMFGVSNQMAEEDLTFKGAYLSDLAKWMRTSKDLWMDEKNVHSERDQWKYETLQTAREMYDYGIIFTSGGQIQDLQQASMDDFRKGRKSDDIMRAKYSQHTLLVGDDGKDVLDPMEATKQEFMEEAMKLVELLIIKLGYGKAGLSQSVMQVIRNSEDIQLELARQLVSGEHANLRDREYANNTDHFAQEIVQAA